MGTALESGFDLSALTACYVAIAFLGLVAFTFRRLAAVLNVGVLGVHPFAGVASAIDNTIVAGLNSAIRSLEKVAARFESGLTDSLKLLVGITALLGLAVKDGFVALWNKALSPFVHTITDPIRREATQAKTKADGVASDLATNVTKLEHRIATDTSAALGKAETFTHDVALGLERDFTRGIDRLDSKLETALRDATKGIEAGVRDSIDALRRGETAAVDSARAAIGATAEELRDFESKIPLTDIAGLIAAVPILRAIVQTLEAETGLDKAECRAKVRGICSTDPTAWGDMLAGLVGGFALLDFRAMVHLASDLGHELKDDFVTYAHQGK